jgi:TIR domain-containing protein
LRYDAFISYSHAADGQLAPALRNGLQRFATPWRVFRWRNPVRALRIFQDQASLSANPALWPTIEQGLGSAEWFILLASPEAANSPWVEKEIDFWCRNKRAERLLIVQTDGDIAWDHDNNDFDWAKTTALPRRLSTVFTDEPRWIDARWARTGAHASLRDPRFRDLTAELAGPLRGIAKDELIGEDIRQHRRLNHWRNAALGVVTMLLIGAVAAAGIAIQQRQVAIQQRQAAIAQRDQAQRNESRALAALANIEADSGSPATAVRLALAAVPPRLATPARSMCARRKPLFCTACGKCGNGAALITSLLCFSLPSAPMARRS